MKFVFIDLFAGAGGVTSAAKKTGKVQVVACVNHDATAIASHKANHPDVLHFTEDIRDMRVVRELAALVRTIRRDDPNVFVILWASLECTNFSKAKGGLPRDADSRTLAEALYQIEDPERPGHFLPGYVLELQPDQLWIENVEEFMCWGELDENGKPISRRKGCDYVKWVNKIMSMGYDFDHNIGNAADFGAYTSRKRYFAQFVRKGLPISWARPTHAKNQKPGDLFEQLQPWKAVREVLDLEDHGSSMFIPGRIKSDKTWERVWHGLVKYVAKENAKQFLQKFHGGDMRHKVKSLDEPSYAVTAQNRLSVVSAEFMKVSNGGDPTAKIYDIDQPSRTITTSDNQSLVRAEFLSKYYGGNPEDKNISIDGPAGTITAMDHHAMIMAYYGSGDNMHPISGAAPTVRTGDGQALILPYAFLDKRYNGTHSHQPVDQPSGTIMGNDKHVLMIPVPSWLDKQYGGKDNHQGTGQPSGSILQNDKHALMTPIMWLMDTQFDNGSKDLDDPSRTITANRKHQYLVTPLFTFDTQFGSNTRSIDQVAQTIIARQDKKPVYLVAVEYGHVAIPVYETDTPWMIKVKEFMAMYNLVDIKMRMLKDTELLRIMGFPEDYILLGNQSQRKKAIGNAVEQNHVAALINESCEAIERYLTTEKVKFA